MKYNNADVRRQNRVLGERAAQRLLFTGEYGVLSMAAGQEGAYGIPLSFVWDGGDCLYFHCAPEGRKLLLLEACNKVSFCIVGGTEILPEKFTTLYESIVIKGTVAMDLPEDERMRALELLVAKYSPDFKETGRKYAEISFSRTYVFRLDMTEYSGKSKQIG